MLGKIEYYKGIDSGNEVRIYNQSVFEVMGIEIDVYGETARITLGNEHEVRDILPGNSHRIVWRSEKYKEELGVK